MPASNGAINGKVFLLQVSGTTVAHSRDMTVTQTRNEIDASDKDDDEEVVLPGRATREVAMQASYVTGDTQREASSSEGSDLRKENARLKKIVAEKELDLSILKEVAEGNF